MLRRAEMRWMSVEDAEITMKARDVALLGREVASLSAALVFYADEANYSLTLPESDQPHAADDQPTARAEQVLAATNGTWSPSPTSYRYAWYRCNSTGTHASVTRRRHPA